MKLWVSIVGVYLIAMLLLFGSANFRATDEIIVSTQRGLISVLPEVIIDNVKTLAVASTTNSAYHQTADDVRSASFYHTPLTTASPAPQPSKEPQNVVPLPEPKTPRAINPCVCGQPSTQAEMYCLDNRMVNDSMEMPCRMQD